jgi:hypothetical protein
MLGTAGEGGPTDLSGRVGDRRVPSLRRAPESFRRRYIPGASALAVVWSGGPWSALAIALIGPMAPPASVDSTGRAALRAPVESERI